MATIDTAKIEGFDGMTAEEKVNALLGMEIPDEVDLSSYVKKSVFDAKASEAAELSKKLKGKMSEDELAAAEREKAQAETDAKLAELQGRYDELVKKSKIAEYTARYVALGYEEALAKDTAEAMQAGDMEKVFSNGEKHKAALEKKIKSDLMAGDPKPGGVNGSENKETEAIEMARSIGKAKAAANKTTADVLSHYIN